MSTTKKLYSLLLLLTSFHNNRIFPTAGSSLAPLKWRCGASDAAPCVPLLPRAAKKSLSNLVHNIFVKI